MIHLSKIQYIKLHSGGRIETKIKIDDKEDTLWIEVNEGYEKYLTFERADAFVVGILNWAMRKGHDIYTENPISETLYYQLTRYLIPTLSKWGKNLYETKLICSIDSSLINNAGGIGTGITGGVDSLYTIMTNESDKFPLHKITHLTFFNVGSHGKGEKAKRLYADRLDQAKRFCEENCYPLVEVNSNLQEVIKQEHFLTATYSATFAILSLQKLWKLYYLASAGNDFDVFRLKDNDLHCCEDYELFSLPLLSTDNLRIESSGAGVTRQNKIKELVKYEPSYKYLNVCTDTGKNCSRCEKCIRTMIGLDATGELDKYSEVFDIDFYKNNKDYCYKIFLEKYFRGWKLHKELYDLIGKKIPFKIYCQAKFIYFKSKIKSFLSSH